MKKVICWVIVVSVILSIFALCGCTERQEKFTDYSFEYFDTVTTIVGFEKTEDIFKQNCAEIKKKLEEYHKLYTIYSRYDGVNNITAINEAAGQKALWVDSKIVEMLEFSKEMHRLTKGEINVAMGSVLSIWHNYREEGMEHPDKAKLPSMAELKKAAAHTEISGLVIDAENNTVALKDGEMSLDVGAIAKGYATEQTALWMESKGMGGYLLNVGGNIRIVGKRPDGERWMVGIENPDTDDEEKPYIEYLELEEMSLVTSGSYQRFYTVNGKNYHHIIDRDTLNPAEYFTLVSVLCKDSAKADALSTALFSMDYESGRKLISSLDDTYALWVTEEGEKLYSDGFKDFCSQ